jgi:hypothetical protein
MLHSWHSDIALNNSTHGKGVYAMWRYNASFHHSKRWIIGKLWHVSKRKSSRKGCRCIYPPLHYDTASYGTVSITLYSTMTTCVQVLLFDFCQATTKILYYSTCTGSITLVLYRCMTRTVHWCCTIAWHVLYTGAVPQNGMYWLFTGRLVLFLLSSVLFLMLIRTYLHSHFLLLFVVIYSSGGMQQMVVLCFLLVAFGWVITSSCLRALIECERQYVLKNPVFGHLQEILIHLSVSNQVDLPLLVLFDSCLFTCSRVVYTQASRKTSYSYFNRQMSHVPSLSPAPCLSESCHYGWSVFVQGWHKQIHPNSRRKTQQTI